MNLQSKTAACMPTVAKEEAGADLIWVPLLVRLAGQANRLVLQRRDAPLHSRVQWVGIRQ